MKGTEVHSDYRMYSRKFHISTDGNIFFVVDSDESVRREIGLIFPDFSVTNWYLRRGWEGEVSGSAD